MSPSIKPEINDSGNEVPQRKGQLEKQNAVW